jgi:hypothetical protein
VLLLALSHCLNTVVGVEVTQNEGETYSAADVSDGRLRQADRGRGQVLIGSQWMVLMCECSFAFLQHATPFTCSSVLPCRLPG